MSRPASVRSFPEKEKDKASSELESQSQHVVVAAGGQLADESGNAIQYRTCSWQKVRSFGSEGMPGCADHVLLGSVPRYRS